MSNGTYSEENAHKFSGVDVNSPFFEKLNKRIFITSAETKLEESEGGVDMELETYLKGYLTDEQEKAAREEEREKVAVNFLRKGINVEVVSEATGFPLERVMELQATLNNN